MHRLFWNTCPRKLDSFPKGECPLGKKGTSSCEWSVGCSESNYCFWTWLRQQSDVKGGFNPPPQNKMAELLGVAPTKIPALIAEALENFKNLEEFDEIKAYLTKE